MLAIAPYIPSYELMSQMETPGFLPPKGKYL